MLTEEQSMKKMEINSRIVCQLANLNAPTWVRPSMIWDDRWLFSIYSMNEIEKEIDIKIRMCIPREEETA